MKAFGGNGTVSAEEKVGAEHIEGADVRYVKPTFGQKIKRHYKRWWWVHLIVFCAGILLIALLLIYVAMPKIAQTDINDSTLSFSSMSFTNPAVDHLTLSGAAIQHSSSIFTPTVDPFNVTMHLVTDGFTAVDAITQIAMPRIHAHHPDTNITIDPQPVPILSSDQVTAFAIQLLNQPNVTVRVEGKTKLHEGALPAININYNASLTFAGLNGLQGFTVIDPVVNLLAPAGQPNLMGTASIPNPTIVTVELGNVTLNIQTAQAGVIGTATVTDFILRPGDNKLPLSAIVNTTGAVSSIQPGGLINLEIIGQTAVYNGVHLPYYEAALKSHTLTVSLNLTQILAGGGL